jgi:glycyl-tRNA synthetase alpha chain
MEVTQFTYFQQVGGFDCKPVAGELTYGLERLAMYIQGVDRVYDLRFNDQGVSYGDVFLANEQELSKYNFEIADTEQLFAGFRHAEAEAMRCIEAGIPLAAYDQAIEASHLFNLLQARGVISVQERASYMGRVRDLAKGSCQAWIDKNAERWATEYPGWSA